MDPNTDLPPMTSDHVADASPPPSTHAHPPYAEMITAAITALKDKDGSSRQAISKYIEKEYTNLPPTHSVLLTHHLKRLKNQGELMMDFQTQTHLAPTGQDLHLHYGSGSDFQGNSGGGAEPLFASLGLGDDGVVVPSPPPTENTSVVAKRGRGRPPKVAGSCGFDVAGPGGDIAGSGGEIQARKTGSGRPVRKPKMMSVLMGTNGGRVKKGRGRPKRIDIGPVTVPLSGNVLRPRGRPKRAVGRPSLRPAQNVAVNGGISESGLPSRRSGRPSLSGGANNKLTGKPVGRPSKIGSGTAVLVTDPRQLQSKVKQVASVVKPCIDPNYGNAALGALQELETLAGADANAPSHIQT
ncbi:AT hook, DNA-binding motif-containing protein [Cynara cardunculus var. scolymus]|uniref:AT hook, DNA-binding motif-containing protein n=1 Tax=Cynara cardunculus var. scolymus TaxID=59895 RepID=A0A103YEV8_CYNCS|nr:AT hook, DNA-binding motif-containing protein [Cynara cardunculus var. scolymus]